MLPVRSADQLDAGTGQIRRGGQHIPKSGTDDGAFRRNAVDGHVIAGVFDFSLVHTHTGCGVCLWVKVAEQHLFPKVVEGRRQVYGGGGFSHAAFLVDDGDYFAHFLLLSFFLQSISGCGSIVSCETGFSNRLSMPDMFHVKHHSVGSGSVGDVVPTVE